jgi:hypothetical protein
MDVITRTNFDLHKQLSSFVSLGDDDELAQLILEVRPATNSVPRILLNPNANLIFFYNRRWLCRVTRTPVCSPAWRPRRQASRNSA